MIPKLFDWLQNHKLSSHAIAAALLGFFGLYTGDPQFAAYVNGLVGHWPQLASGLAVAVGIYLRYSQSVKPTLGLNRN